MNHKSASCTRRNASVSKSFEESMSVHMLEYVEDIEPPMSGLDEEELSVIEVDPSASQDLGRFPSLKRDSGLDNESSKCASTTSNSSYAVGMNTSSDRGGTTSRRDEAISNSLSSLLSNFSLKLTGQADADMQKGNKTEGGSSPISVLEVDAAPQKRTEQRDHPSEIAVNEPLKQPVFSPSDETSALEFQEFLDEDGGHSHRIPVLCLVDYGMPGAYASDIFVLLHNTIRRELFDAFELLDIVRRRFRSLTYEDVHKLRGWWKFFELLWNEYLMFEKTCLDPLIQQIRQVDGRSDVLVERLDPLTDTREWLELKMVEVTSYIDEFEKLPPGRALCLFCKNVDNFADKIMTYFSRQERLLPPFIESYHGEDIRVTLEGQLIERFRKSESFPELLVSIVRWMGTVQGYCHVKTQSKERDKWLNTHLFWLERQKLPFFFRRYESIRGSVLLSFRRKLKNSNTDRNAASL